MFIYQMKNKKNIMNIYMLNYIDKYYKYKTKYINLKKELLGGKIFTFISLNEIKDKQLYRLGYKLYKIVAHSLKEFINEIEKISSSEDIKIIFNGRHIDIYDLTIEEFNKLDAKYYGIVFDYENFLDDIKYGIITINDLPEQFRKDQIFIMRGLVRDHTLFDSLKLKDDKKFYLKLVKINGMLLEKIPDKFKNDEDILLAAIHNSPFAITLIPETKKNRDFYLLAVKQDGLILQFLEDFKDDYEIVSEAIKENIEAYKYASKNLKQDERILSILKDDHQLEELYKSKKLKFIHIGKSDTRMNTRLTESYLDYSFYSESDISEDILSKILDESEYDIVIFVEDVDDSIIKLLNKIIESIKINKKNIKIFNLSKQKIKNNNNFYKIVNILIYGEYTDVEYTDEYADYDYDINFELKLYIYRKIRLSEDKQKNRLLAIHWLNYLFNTPRCLEGRFIQISETCWLNSIINILLLTDKLRDKIFPICEDYFKEKESVDYTKMRSSHENLRFLLLSLFNNIRLNKKAKTDEDFMIVLASLIIDYSINSDDFMKYIKTLDPDGYKFYEYYSESRELSLKYRKNDEQPIYKLCRANDDNLLRKELCEYKEINREKINELNRLCYYNNGKSICDDYEDYTNEYKGFIFGDSGYNEVSILFILKIIFDLDYIPKFNEIFELGELKVYLEYKPENIEIKINRLNLKACSLDTKDHSICGIKDNDDFYVYNSATNIWSRDDWSKLNGQKYTELSELKKKSKNMNEDFNYTVIFTVYTS